MASERNVVVGVFRDRDRARDAIQALKDVEFSGDDISVLMPNTSDSETLAEDTGTQAATGAATGAIAGGLLGGLGGWLIGVGALAIPGVGPLVAAGAIATALTGAAVGAGVGAIAGALVGLGIPEEEAKYYEEEVRGGRTLVTVRADGRFEEAQAILRRYGAYDIQTRDTVGGATYEGATTGSPLTATDPMARPELGPEAAAYARAQGGTSAHAGYQTTELDTAATSSSAAMADTAARRWADEAPRFRTMWEQQHRGDDARWERFEPLFRYGWEHGQAAEYRGRPWSQVEPELQRDWARRYPDRSWSDAADAIRLAWMEVTSTSARR